MDNVRYNETLTSTYIEQGTSYFLFLGVRRIGLNLMAVNTGHYTADLDKKLHYTLTHIHIIRICMKHARTYTEYEATKHTLTHTQNTHTYELSLVQQTTHIYNLWYIAHTHK